MKNRESVRWGIWSGSTETLSYGTSELREWLHDIVSFQNETGELDRRDLARLERLHYVTDIYLKAVKAPAKK